MIFRIFFTLGLLLPVVSAVQGKFAQSLDLFVKFLGLFTIYTIFFVLVSLLSSWLSSRHPALADRLACFSNWLVPNQNYQITRLAIHKHNPAKADQIWADVSSRLDRLKPGNALALATNYSASLSTRGQYRRARDLLLSLDPSKASKSYRLFVVLYRLNLGFFRFQLGQFDEARRCLEKTKLESIGHKALRERYEGLEILLAMQSDRPEALRLLRKHDRKRAFAALILAELGQIDEAARRLPDQGSLSDPWELKYYHLARMWLAETPVSKREALSAAGQSAGGAGLVAWHARLHLQESAYLERARREDPESIWTRQAEGLG